jgi:hypothetical protein
MPRSVKVVIVLIVIALVLGIGGFIVLQFFNPFRQYPSTSTISDSPTLDDILMPSWPGTKALEKNGYIIDYSNTSEGYVAIKGANIDTPMKAQLIKGDLTVSYDVYPDRYTIVVLTAGSGAYTVRTLKQKEGNAYSVTATLEINVTLKDEFTPFLYPNQIVNYTKDTLAVKKSFELTQGLTSQLERVHAVYQYIVTTIDYDYEKAKRAQDEFLIPVLDETLTTQKGICFDYAALMAAMLRVQHIPTRVVTGYVDVGYHAWVETYIDGIGWINPSLYFEKETWERIDPTFDAQGPYFGKYQDKLYY